MKKVFFALILNLFFINISWGDNIKEYEKTCRDFIVEPEVDFEYSYGRLRYRFDKPRESIRKIMQRKGVTANCFDGHCDVNGVTLSDVAFMFDIDIGVTDINRQYVCVYPEKFNVFLGYEHPVIFVAQELKKGTCAYDLTLRHEKTHMQIYLEGLDYFLPQFKQYLDGLYDEIGVRIVKKDDVESALKSLSEAYHMSSKQKFDDWYAEIEKEQRKQDSNNHYYLETAICEALKNKYK